MSSIANWTILLLLAHWMWVFPITVCGICTWTSYGPDRTGVINSLSSSGSVTIVNVFHYYNCTQTVTAIGSVVVDGTTQNTSVIFAFTCPSWKPIFVTYTYTSLIPDSGNPSQTFTFFEALTATDTAVTPSSTSYNVVILPAAGGKLGLVLGSVGAIVFGLLLLGLAFCPSMTQSKRIILSVICGVAGAILASIALVDPDSVQANKVWMGVFGVIFTALGIVLAAKASLPTGRHATPAATKGERAT